MIPLTERIPEKKHKDIYDFIRKQPSISKIELLEQTKLSVSTLTRMLEEMCGMRLILEAGFGVSTGGRKPILYQTNSSYGYLFGLEISRTYSMLFLCDMHLNKLDSRKWGMNEGMTPEVLLEEISYSVRNMLAVHGISMDSVIGMGIGAVGPLDRLAGIIIDPLHFPAYGWKNIAICKLFETEFDFPILLDNGSNMAIMGEYWASRNRDYQHMLYIHVGIGLRSAIMAGGKVVYGAVDMEDSIGQMIIQPDGLRLRETGNFGSLENYATIYALEKKAQARLKQGRKSVLQQISGSQMDLDRIKFDQLVQAFLEQDPLAVELFTQAATYFGIGLSNLLNILHPEKVILGGPLINFHPMFFQVSTEVALQKTHQYPTYRVEFSQGNLGQDALVIGAAVAVLNKITE
jgi:predicted NBD/HSP70 family sugar kinase